MDTARTDLRSPARRILDEQIATEPMLPPPERAPGATPGSMEAHIRQLTRRPLPEAGIVENGLVRLLDPAGMLPEHSRVIIVLSEVI